MFPPHGANSETNACAMSMNSSPENFRANESRGQAMPSAAENGPCQYSADELKLLCLLRWSDTKVVSRQDSGAYLLRKGKMLLEATPLTLAELLPHLDWLAAVPTTPVCLSKINRRDARRRFPRRSV